MISSMPYEPTRDITGTVTAVEQRTAWQPSDRHQTADVMIDGAEPFTLIGRAPEEFMLRKPRRRPVDASDVAALRVGDRVRIAYKANRLVTFLTVLEKAGDAGIAMDTPLGRHMAMLG